MTATLSGARRAFKDARVVLVGDHRSSAARRWGRPLCVGLTLLLLVWAALVWYEVVIGSIRRGEVGYDLGLYARIAEHWLVTGGAYFPEQFAGPYANVGEVNLYPPLALYLFVPFTVLPALLWWAIPLTIYGATLAHYRPAWWSWPYLAFVAGTVAFSSEIVYGNSEMWSLAILCVAQRLPWAAPFLAWKPSDLLFAIPFIRRRGFWLSMGAVVVLALPSWALWIDYLRALANFRGETLLYGLQGWVVLLSPFVVRAAATRRPGTDAASSELGATTAAESTTPDAT